MTSRSGGPQVGEVTRLGGVTCMSIESLILIWTCLHDRWGDHMRDYMYRRVTPPKWVTSPTWGPSPPCIEALSRVALRWKSVFQTEKASLISVPEGDVWIPRGGCLVFDELDLDSPVANLNTIKICIQYNNQYKYKTPGVPPG